MKKLILILLLLTIAAAAFLYLNPELRQEVRGLVQSSGLTDASTTFYKWRDADGVLQYTQTPPPEGIAFEQVEARSDVNVMPLPDELKPE